MNHFSQGRRSGATSFSTFTNFGDISEKTRAHLTKVYTLLMVCCFVCAFGMFVNSTFLLHGFLWSLLSIAVSIYFVYNVVN
jgi:hypothetical protein